MRNGQLEKGKRERQRDFRGNGDRVFLTLRRGEENDADVALATSGCNKMAVKNGCNFTHDIIQER
jgi:hypothetical protein